MKKTNLNDQTNASAKRPLKALLLSLLMPGLGQIYNGHFTKGLVLFTLFAGALPLFSRLAVRGPKSALWILVVLGVTTAFFVFVFSAVSAFIAAGRDEASGIFNVGAGARVVLLSLLFGILFVLRPLSDDTRRHVVELYRIPSKSMSPTVEEGDYVFVDKRIHSDKPPFSVKRGDIVVFVYPNDRTRTYIKRAAALPGEEIEADGKKLRVPNGHIFVLGDNKENAEDSRRFGPVPLSDVIGIARQIWFNPTSPSIFDRLGKLVT